MLERTSKSTLRSRIPAEVVQIFEGMDVALEQNDTEMLFQALEGRTIHTDTHVINTFAGIEGP